MKKQFEINNLDYMVKEYGTGFEHGNLLLGIDVLTCGNGSDLVVYDTSDMSEVPTSIEEFYEIINKNGLDEESYEIDRCTFVKIDEDLSSYD